MCSIGIELGRSADADSGRSATGKAGIGVTGSVSDRGGERELAAVRRRLRIERFRRSATSFAPHVSGAESVSGCTE